MRIYQPLTLCMSLLVPLPGFALQCEVSGVAPMFAPIVQLKPGNVDAQGSITVSCDPVAMAVQEPMPVGGLVTAVVSLGTGNSGTHSQRRGGSAQNPGPGYNLFTTAGHATVFGDGSNGTQTASCSMTFAVTDTQPKSCQVMVFGRTYGTQNPDVRRSPFSDPVGITVSYP